LGRAEGERERGLEGWEESGKNRGQMSEIRCQREKRVEEQRVKGGEGKKVRG